MIIVGNSRLDSGLGYSAELVSNSVKVTSQHRGKSIGFNGNWKERRGEEGEGGGYPGKEPLSCQFQGDFEENNGAKEIWLLWKTAADAVGLETEQTALQPPLSTPSCCRRCRSLFWVVKAFCWHVTLPRDWRRLEVITEQQTLLLLSTQYLTGVL